MRVRYERVALLALPCVAALLTSCTATPERPGGHPDFITSNADYYTRRIASVPEIDEASYELAVTGLVTTPRTFTLEELRALDMVELPLTIECIGNSPEGPQLSTAVWKGFRLHDLLLSLGVKEGATGVQYAGADGYYASHTLEQIEENGVVGALYMNGEVIPALHGFPVRFLNPGYYGVKQPAWVTEIRVIDRPIKDYWEDRGWDCSPPMAIDSTIFFPDDGATVAVGEPLEVGGAAFGGTRVARVELTSDGGETWQEADIVESLDADYVWVFWKATLEFQEAGPFFINARATDVHGNIQPEHDPERHDGANDWPVLSVKVSE